MNKKFTAMKCIHCQKVWEIADYSVGCPDCYEKGTPSALTFVNNIDWEIQEEKKE